MTEENNKPIKQFKSGGITASVWKNVIKTEKETYESCSITFQKNFLNSDKEWKTTTSFKTNDLPKIALLSNVAYQWLTLSSTEGKRE